MKLTRILTLGLLAITLAMPAHAGDDAYSEVYGTDHLHPSPESLLGRYLQESGAYSFPRKFAIDGVDGPARLVVSVSEDSFPILAKYFSSKKFLHFFHEPLTTMVQTAFDGKRGSMGRLPDKFRYTQSGVDLIPITLSDGESKRADLYFQLATDTQRGYDFANFPWYLTGIGGRQYTRAGNVNSVSDWFSQMPIGESLDESEKRNSYRLNPVPMAARSIITQVWTVPYSHASLAQMLELKPYDGRGFSTPGAIAMSLLASASVERVPVLFRFVNDHRAVLDPAFDLWVDLNFNPDKE